MNKQKVKFIFVHIFLICFTFVTIFPVLKVVQIAFGTESNFNLSVNPFPTEFSLKNFKEVLTSSKKMKVEKVIKNDKGKETKITEDKEVWLFGRQLFNSLVVSIATALMGILLACTAAYAFSRFKFPGQRAGLMAFLVTQMFPGTMMMIPLYIIIEKLGLLDQMLGLILVYSTTSIPFCVWNLKGYFDTIPKELEEAAIIDGASHFRVFWQIVMPLCKPALAVTFLFSFMTGWNEFILAATFMSNETSYTLPVMLQQFIGEYSVDWGHFAAGALIVSIPVMALFFALQRNLVSGLTAGAVKG